MADFFISPDSPLCFMQGHLQPVARTQASIPDATHDTMPIILLFFIWFSLSLLSCIIQRQCARNPSLYTFPQLPFGILLPLHLPSSCPSQHPVRLGAPARPPRMDLPHEHARRLHRTIHDVEYRGTRFLAAEYPTGHMAGLHLRTTIEHSRDLLPATRRPSCPPKGFSHEL